MFSLFPEAIPKVINHDTVNACCRTAITDAGQSNEAVYLISPWRKRVLSNGGAYNEDSGDSAGT